MNKTRTARKLLLVLMVFCGGDLLASSNKATDAAFAALLSMPGGGPAQGQWGTPVPDDFSPGAESALIAYLAQKQKAGADFNAIRHRGTLLHHAIRAGTTQTAIWLLEHGADPKQVVAGDGGGDALALSLAYKRTSLARLLQEKYGLKTPLPTAPPNATPAPRMVSPADIDGARAMLAQASSISTIIRQSRAIHTSTYAKAYRQMLENWASVSAGMAPEIYAKVMDDDKAMSDLVILHSGSVSELDQALARMPAPIIKRRATAAIVALAGQSRMEIDSESKSIRYSVPAEVWRTLWRRLGQPLDYGGTEWLARNVPPELWPELLASGFDGNRTERAFGCMLSEIGARDFKAIWPQLVANFPNIRQQAPSLVLAPYRFHGSYPCWQTDGEAIRDKLLFLTSVGVEAPVRGVLKQQLDGAGPDLLAAMRPFLAGATPAPRLVDATANCTFSLTEPWYRKLLEGTSSVPELFGIESVQLVEIPGEAECGLLVGGERILDFDFMSGAIVDSFTGPELNPNPSCPDPLDRFAVWQNRQGTIVELETDMGYYNGSSTLTPVRDTLTGQRYFLHNGAQFGKCNSGQRLPFTFEWRRTDKEWSLMRTGFEKHQAALFDQCSDDEKGGVQCRGIAAVTAYPEAETKPDPFMGMTVHEFMKTLGQGRYREYMQAVAALDKAKLKEMRATGVPGMWTTEAILQVSESDLPLIAKRARTAWIFADHLQLARAFDDRVFQALLPWLPREDWRPVLNVIAKRPYDYRNSIWTNAADRARNADLACDIDNALGLVCGEKLQTD